MTAANTWDELYLPWTESVNDKRFKKILRNTLIAFCVIALLLTFLPKPQPPAVMQDLKDVSPRLAKLIVEKKKEPPPPPPVPVAEKKPVEKPEPEPEIKPDAEPVPQKNVAQENISQARAKASRSGLLALSNKLTTLQDSFDVKDFSDVPLKKQTSAAAKPGNDDVFKTDMITSGIAETSKGIGSKAVATTSSGTTLAEHSTSNVKSELSEPPASQEKRGPGSTRTEAEIARVFEENKSAIYSMYNRALRGDPSLQGKVVLELTIEADGSVSACRIISSELNNAEFEKKLIARVKLFRFKPGNIKQAVIKYPIDFVPS